MGTEMKLYRDKLGNTRFLILEGGGIRYHWPLDDLPDVWGERDPLGAGLDKVIRMREKILRHIWGISPARSAVIVLEHYRRAG